MKINLTNIFFFKNQQVNIGDVTILTGGNNIAKTNIGNLISNTGMLINNEEIDFQKYYVQKFLNFLFRYCEKYQENISLDENKRLDKDILDFFDEVRKYLYNMRKSYNGFHYDKFFEVYNSFIKFLLNGEIENAKQNIVRGYHFYKRDILREIEIGFSDILNTLNEHDKFANTIDYLLLDNFLWTINDREKINYSFELSNYKLSVTKKEKGLEKNINWPISKFPSIHYTNDLLNKQKFEVRKNGNLYLNEFYSFILSRKTNLFALESGQEEGLKEIYKLIEDLTGTHKDSKSSIFITKRNDFLNESKLSDGVRVMQHLKELIANNYFYKGGLFIFDEIENHLHPDWQIKISKVLYKLTEILKCKIFIITHSPYVLYYFSEMWEHKNDKVVFNFINKNINEEYIIENNINPIDLLAEFSEYYIEIKEK